MSKSKSKKIKSQAIKPYVEKKSVVDDYPLFCFKYLQEASYPDCKDASFFHGFLRRLQKLSECGWSQIRTSDRHCLGMEKIPIKQIKKNIEVPIITPDVKHLHVFRATGKNNVFIGLQETHIFHIIFIEYQFGDIYNHGRK